MSSSSDEDLSKFKEAADVKLFNNSLFVEGKAEHTAISPVKPSLRYLDTPEQNRTDLKVTPGFQKHVASHLMKMLDSSLDQAAIPTCTTTSDHDSNGNCTSKVPEPEAPKNPEGGIKLFGASAAFLASCNIVPPPPTKRRKRGRKHAFISSGSEDDSSSNEADIGNPLNKRSPVPVKAKSLGTGVETELSERFAACAVSPDWILNGDAVKGWALPFKTKEPIQGEATPDLLKVAFMCRREKEKKKRRKKEKCLKEESKKLRVRGKRGKKSTKKKIKESDIAGDGLDPSDNAEFLTTAPKKKKRRKESHPECRQEENEYGLIEHRHSRKCKAIRTLLGEFAERELEGTKGEVLSIHCTGGGKEEKRKVKMKVTNVENRREVEEALNNLFKKVKKEMKKLKKRRSEREKNLPSAAAAAAAAAEDEGFDSDPTKTDKKRRQQRKLLKAKLKKQRKKEKKWQNNMDYLSNDLANLAMTNVKQD